MIRTQPRAVYLNTKHYEAKYNLFKRIVPESISKKVPDLVLPGLPRA
jgi:hypothetical protein